MNFRNHPSEENSVTVLSDFNDENSVIVLSDSSDAEDENSTARAQSRSRRLVTPQTLLLQQAEMGGRIVVRRIEPRRILAPLDLNRAERRVAIARAVPRGNRAGRHVARGMRAIRIRRVPLQIVTRRRVAPRNGNVDQNGARGGVARAAAVPRQDEAQRLLEANGVPFPPFPNRDYYHQVVPCFYRVSHVPLHHVENDILHQRCCQLIAIFSVQYSIAIQTINPFNVRGMNALVGGSLLRGEGTT